MCYELNIDNVYEHNVLKYKNKMTFVIIQMTKIVLPSPGSYTVKPNELVQLKPFEETDRLKPFKLGNSNNLGMKKSLIWVPVTHILLL